MACCKNNRAEGGVAEVDSLKLLWGQSFSAVSSKRGRSKRSGCCGGKRKKTGASVSSSRRCCSS